MALWWRHEAPYDTHSEVVINRVKFDVCSFSSFREVKGHMRAYARADRIALEILNFFSIFK